MLKPLGFCAALVSLVIFVGACGDGADVTTGPSTSSTNATSTGAGATVTQDRQVGEFVGVAISVPGRLFIEHGATHSLTITGDETALAVITSEVRDGNLTIEQLPNTDLRLDDVLEIEYRVTIGTLQRLWVAGTVHASATGVDTTPFEVNVAGASEVSVAGRTNRQVVTLAGSCRYEAGGLASRDAVLQIAGSAFAKLQVSDSLTGSITGSAVVRYTGTPDVSVTVTGSADIASE